MLNSLFFFGTNSNTGRVGLKYKTMSIVKGSSYWLQCEEEDGTLTIEYFDRENKLLCSEVLTDEHFANDGEDGDSCINQAGHKYATSKLDLETKGGVKVQTVNVVDMEDLPYYFLRFDVAHTVGFLVYPRMEPVNQGAIVRYIHEHMDQTKVLFDDELSPADAFDQDSFTTAKFLVKTGEETCW